MLAYAGYCSLLFELGEIDQAHFEYQRVYNRVKEIHEELVNRTSPSKLSALEFLKVDIERFWGYKKEIETVKSLNMSYEDWMSLTAGKEDGVYLIKLGEFKIDSMEAKSKEARHNTETQCTGEAEIQIKQLKSLGF